MAIVVDIEGPSAVGKTTLIREIKTPVKIITFPEISPDKNFLKTNSLSIEDNFIKTQRWFLEQYLERYKNANKYDKNQLIISDRGITDILIFTRYWPEVKGFCEDCELFLKAISPFELSTPVADFIIYLDAELPVLRERKERDNSRLRDSYESNLLLLSYEKTFYKKLKKALKEKVFIVNASRSLNSMTKEVISILQSIQGKKSKILLSELVDILK